MTAAYVQARKLLCSSRRTFRRKGVSGAELHFLELWLCSPSNIAKASAAMGISRQSGHRHAIALQQKGLAFRLGRKMVPMVKAVLSWCSDHVERVAAALSLKRKMRRLRQLVLARQLKTGKKSESVTSHATLQNKDIKFEPTGFVDPPSNWSEDEKRQYWQKMAENMQ